MCAALRFLSNDEIADMFRKLFDVSSSNIELSDNAEYFYEKLLDFSNEQRRKKEKQTSGLKQYQNRRVQKTSYSESGNDNNKEHYKVMYD